MTGADSFRAGCLQHSRHGAAVRLRGAVKYGGGGIFRVEREILEGSAKKIGSEILEIQKWGKKYSGGKIVARN